MRDVVTKRAHGRVWFNAGPERWSFPDPTTERHADARHAARYGTPPNYAVAEQAETLAYLVAFCPTTELAVKKLRAMRRAVRESSAEGENG